MANLLDFVCGFDGGGSAGSESATSIETSCDVEVGVAANNVLNEILLTK